MSRIILCGRIHLSEPAFAKAQELPILEVFDEDPDDDLAMQSRLVSARDAFSPDDHDLKAWARNAYDRDDRSWLFGCSIHDDDWHNSDPDLIENSLVAAKDGPGRDVVFAFIEWNRKLDSAWVIEAGCCLVVEPLPALPEVAATLILDGNLEAAERLIRALI